MPSNTCPSSHFKIFHSAVKMEAVFTLHQIEICQSEHPKMSFDHCDSLCLNLFSRRICTKNFWPASPKNSAIHHFPTVLWTRHANLWVVSWNSIPSLLTGRSVNISQCIYQSCTLYNSSCPMKMCHCFRVWLKAWAPDFIRTSILLAVFLAMTNQTCPLLLCQSIWLSGRVLRREPQTTLELVEEEIKQGWVYKFQGSIDDAKKHFSHVAIGRLGVAFSDSRPPRLVVDSSVCGVNDRCKLPERTTLPSAKDVIRCFPLRNNSRELKVFHWISKALTKESSWRKVIPGIFTEW